MTPFRQVLPDLDAYRRDLVAAGAPGELPFVPTSPAGLLSALPEPLANRTGWPWNMQVPSDTWAADVPAITVAMPSYNQGRYLEEAIRSVLLQNYPRLQFVIMDGGSTDDSLAVIEKYRPWFSYARSEKDRGQAHAINLALSLATGELVAWLNSDDLYLPNTFSDVITARLKGAEFVYGDAIDLDDGTGYMRYEHARVVRARYTRWGGLVLQPTAFWVRAKHQPLWEEQWCSLDYELWIRLLPKMRTRHTASALAVARRHELAKTYNPEIKKRWDDDARRNGAAHPELYQPTLMNRVLALEYRVTQRLAAKWRHRFAAQRVARVASYCGWKAHSS